MSNTEPGLTDRGGNHSQVQSEKRRETMTHGEEPNEQRSSRRQEQVWGKKLLLEDVGLSPAV